MTATVLTITDADVLFHAGETAPTDWLTADNFQCQVVTARVNATANLAEVAATFCQGATQTPGLSSFEVELSGLQDWTVADGLSMFLFDNDGLPGWMKITLPNKEPGSAQASIVCKVGFVAGSFGGEAGTALTFEAGPFPVQGKPAVTQGTASATMAADEEAAA